MPSCHTRNTCDAVLSATTPDLTPFQLAIFLFVVFGVPALIGWLVGAHTFKTFPFNSKEDLK